MPALEGYNILCGTECCFGDGLRHHTRAGTSILIEQAHRGGSHGWTGRRRGSDFCLWPEQSGSECSMRTAMNILQQLIDILDMRLQGLETAMQVILIGTNKVSNLHTLLLDIPAFLRPCCFFLQLFLLAQYLYKCMSGSGDDKTSISAFLQGTWSSFCFIYKLSLESEQL